MENVINKLLRWEKLKSWHLLNIFLPLLLWAIVFSIPYFSGIDNLPKSFRDQHLRSMFWVNSLLIVIFYVHTYLIYPLREQKNGLWHYLFWMAICIAAYLFLVDFFRPDFPPDFGKGKHFGPPPRGKIRPLFPFCFVIAVSFCYQLYLDKVRREKLIKERENIHLKTELDFLSSQISPHFMFNTLNTMVAMARKKSDALESSLISLSQLMRYMLYDHNGKAIRLHDEIEYLKSYIDLQLIRFEDDVVLNMRLDGDFTSANISPMLLIPFIENAFKHGIGNIKAPTIDISILLKGEVLTMSVINSIATMETTVERSTGIGLNNVKRRLELLYPDRHIFSVNRKSNTFIAMLQINL